MRLVATLALAALGCSSTVTQDLADAGGAVADVGAIACSAAQPRCRIVGTSEDIFCCTQATACGVCFGDGITGSQCVDGEWVCDEGRIFFSQCTATWTPYGDAGPLPECDAG